MTPSDKLWTLAKKVRTKNQFVKMFSPEMEILIEEFLLQEKGKSITDAEFFDISDAWQEVDN